MDKRIVAIGHNTTIAVVPACALLEFAHSCCVNGKGVNYLGRQQVYQYLVSLHGMTWMVQHESEVKKELATVEAMMEMPEYQPLVK